VTSRVGFLTPLALFKGTLDVTLGVTLGDVGPLVVGLLSARQPDFDLDLVSLREVKLQRDERVASLFDLADEVANLLAVHQELALPVGIDVLPVPVAVRLDVHVEQPDLTLAHGCVRVLNRQPVVANRLDLGTGQHDAALEGFLDREVMVRTTVGRYDPALHI